MNSLYLYMSYAQRQAQKSKCIKDKVGAVIVDKHQNIIGQGYNRTLSNTPCEEFVDLDTQMKTSSQVIHAEIDCFISSVLSYKDCTLYVTTSPCLKCAKEIVKRGISVVVYNTEHTKIDGVKYLIKNNIQVIDLQKEIKDENK